MGDNLISNQLARHSHEIDDLRKSTVEIEKKLSIFGVSLEYLSSNIDKLSLSIDKLADCQNKKGIGNFIKENWYRIPTIFVLIYGIVYAANFIDDKFIPESKKYKNQSEVKVEKMNLA